MYIQPPPGFRGFVWEPSSEQDVVVLFGRLLETLDTPLAIDYSWTAFPDCNATDTTTGDTVHIEFEFRSSNFWYHRREWLQLKAAAPSAHWWVVSWHDDLDERQRRELRGLQIVALRDRVWKHDQEQNTKMVLNWYVGDPGDPEQMFDWRSARLSTDHRHVIDQLRRFGRNIEGFRVGWPTKPDLPWFTVRHERTGVECFKVHANGRIGFPFSRWPDTFASRKTDLIGKLNTALATDWFTGREERKKGCDAAWLLRRDGRTADAFLAVWESALTLP